MDPFQSLSTEIMILIFEHFNPQSLISGMATCCRWNSILKWHQFVYSLLCYRYGYADGPYDPEVSTTDRLAALQAHVARNCEVQSIRGQVVSANGLMLKALSCGLVAVGEPLNSKICGYSDIMRRERWIVDTKVELKGFAINHYHDLLVVLGTLSPRWTRLVHLKSISDGEPRKDLPFYTLVVTQPPEREENGSSIKLSDNYIGILFYYTVEFSAGNRFAHELVVWDWRTGNLVLHVTPSKDCHVNDFSFVSATHILVAWKRTGLKWDEGSLDRTSLLLYDLRQDTAIPSRQFIIPFVAGRAVLLRLLLGSTLPSIPGSCSPRTFYASPDEGITQVFIHYDAAASYAGEIQHVKLALVTLNSTFLKDYSSVTGSTFPDTSPTSIPWEMWGTMCRVLPWRLPPGPSCMHGTKIVNKMFTEIQGLFKIRVYNFGRRRTIEGSPTPDILSAYESIPPSLIPPVTLPPNCMTHSVWIGETLYAALDQSDLWIDEDNIYMYLRRGERSTIQVLKYRDQTHEQSLETSSADLV